MLASARRRMISATLSAIVLAGFIAFETSASAAGAVRYRINAGGPVLSGTPGWAEDSKAKPSPFSNSAATGTASTSTAIDMSDSSVPPGTPQAMFKSERYDREKSAADMQWNFPVTAGTYEVRLYFAETWNRGQSPGDRVFDVSIEKALVLDDFDVFADVGGYKGVVKSFNVTSDSNLDIDFGRATGSPMIKGIEVLSSSAGNPPAAPAACADGKDNDGDDKIDYPADPGCTSSSDNDETDTAPVPTDDRCSGVAVTGGGSALENALKAKSAGTTFCVAPGTYTASSGGLQLESGDKIDGAGTAHPGSPGGQQPSVFIKGSGYLVLGGSGARVTVQDVDITDPSANSGCSSAPSCEATVDPADGWLIQRTRIHHGDNQCIGSPGYNLVVDDVELDHCANRFDSPNNNGFAAGIKGGATPKGAYVIRSSYVHDNNQGIWCDRDCESNNSGVPLQASPVASSQAVGFQVTNNIVRDNCSFGIHYEKTYFFSATPAKATISGNEVVGNDWCDLANKADIGIVSAENAVVTDNDTGATTAHPRRTVGITVFDRGPGPSTGSASGNRLHGDSLRCESPFKCSNNS